MKIKITTLIIVTLLANPIKASSALASSFGWSGVDDTQALYNAFTANVDTLYVDLQSGDWISGPLIFDGSVNNKTVIFERGVKIRALSEAYNSYLYNGLFSFIDCSNVSLIGYGATLQMNKQEYINLNDGSEWRHLISLSGCKDFNIYGFELLDSGGDGIEISGIWGAPVPGRNIHIKDCRIDNNYRQGISVTSAVNVIIEHCEITNTDGTPPAFGIDLEPDNDYDLISEIEIINCRISGNEGGGILISLWNLSGNSDPVSVKVSDCYIDSNQNEGIVIDVNSNGAVSGSIAFARCIVANQPGNGIFSNKRESLALSFKDMIIRNVGTNGSAYDMPIFIQKQYDYSGFPLGNITFENVFIDDRLFARDFLNISHWGESTQVENIAGNFFIYNPNGETYYIEPPLDAVDIATQTLSGLPLTEIQIFSNDNTAYEIGEDTSATFTISRTDGNFSVPLDVYFNLSGNAENRLDYNYFPKALVIPSETAGVTYTVSAIKDELTEPIEQVDLTIQTDNHYSISNGTVRLFIGDLVLGIKETEQASLDIYPNPVTDHISIRSGRNETGKIKIYNILGQLIKTFDNSNAKKIDVSFLNPGIYILLFDTPSEKISVKFIKL